MLTMEQKLEIKEKIEGTTMLDSIICDEYEIDLNELEEAMLDLNFERCPTCGVWQESNEFIDSNDEKFPDDSCRSCQGEYPDDIS